MSLLKKALRPVAEAILSPVAVVIGGAIVLMLVLCATPEDQAKRSPK